MNFLQIAQARYSLRQYSSAPIEKEKLAYILECARLAPSAVNYQPWKFVIVSKKEMMDKLHEAYVRDWFRSAHTCIIAIGDHSQSWKRQNDGKDHCDIDFGIAVEHIVIAATEQGLGTCWVCNFDTQLVREILQLPANLEPIALIPIGYADSSVLIPDKKRKDLEQITTWIE